MTNYLTAEKIPNAQKRAFLLKYNEDDFRDSVLRPLYKLEGLKHGADLCGPNEQGKDCYFWQDLPVTGKMVIAVQTKKGDIKMSANAQDNLINAITQLKTALETRIRCITDKKFYHPDVVILAASGIINEAAREHIIYSLGNDNRIKFQDFDSLVNRIDSLMPELWYGINTKVLPYLSRLKSHLCQTSDCIDISPLLGKDKSYIPITDDTFVPLYLNRISIARERIKGEYRERFDYKDVTVEKVTSLSQRLILIMGEAGAGKSIALKRIALTTANRLTEESNKEQIPVLFTASQLAESSLDCAALAAKVTISDNSSDGPAFSLEDLANGRILLLIDAYDEIATDKLREEFVNKIKLFHERFTKCQIIVTSRKTPKLSTLESTISMSVYEVSPLNVKQALKIVDRLSSGIEMEASAKREIIRKLENVHGIELNPLLVTLFVASSEFDRADVPANITELFDKFTDLMLGRWDLSKGLSQQHHTQVKKFIVSQLAMKMHRERVTRLPISDAKELIRKSLEDTGHTAQFDVMYDEAIGRSGLLYEQDEFVAFKHLMLQEFFAGNCMEANDFSSEMLGDYWWTRPYVFNAGLTPKDASKLQKLVDLSRGCNDDHVFQAGVTIGLAMQACYLTKLDLRRKIFFDVIEILSLSYEDAIRHFKNNYVGDSVCTLFCYLYGRDSVASSVALAVYEEYKESNTFVSLDDLEKFWIFAGLIENRTISIAANDLKKFSPSNDLLLLALHSGLYQLENLQLTTKEVRKVASEIRGKIEPKIAYLMKQVFDEMKGYLLEIRKGKLSVVENE